MLSPGTPLYGWWGLNRALFRWINGLHAPWWDALMQAASAAGGAAAYPYWVAAALLIALLRPRVLPQANAAAFALGFVATGFLVPWLKAATGLPRPGFALGEGVARVLGSWSHSGAFPSGHATFVALMAAALGYRAPRALRWGLWTFAALVGLSRVALGAHFPADVVGGALLGFAVAFVLRWALVLAQRLGRAFGG